MTNLPNILIVDDIKENLAFLRALLKKFEINLIQALSGFEALEKAEGIDIALAIIDVRMPVMNGYDLAMKLNENRITDKIPLIFLTASYFNEEEVFKGYGSGAVDYIYKPVDSHVLISKVKVFLDLFNQKKKISENTLELQKKSEELQSVNNALKISEAKYRSYIDNAPDGVFVADENGKYLEVNKAACIITGYSKRELLKLHFYDLLADNSKDVGLKHFKKLIKNGSSKVELMFTHKTGEQRWWTVESVKLSETQFLGFTKDITERKKADEELKNSLDQLHQLSKHVEKVRENERIAISRELHDDLGQALTAVKIDLGMLKIYISDNKGLVKINKVINLVSDTIKTVQRITSQLRPEIIDDLGLEPAIEWYTKEFSQRNGIEIFLDINSDFSISPDDSLIIFRIMQESLTNISRHAQASHIDIKLYKKEDYIYLIITDNGIGISEENLKSKKSFGLIGMMERAASLGGSFNIYNKNGNGTVAKLMFPTKKLIKNENSDL